MMVLTLLILSAAVFFASMISSMAIMWFIPYGRERTLDILQKISVLALIAMMICLAVTAVG